MLRGMHGNQYERASYRLRGLVQVVPLSFLLPSCLLMDCLPDPLPCRLLDLRTVPLGLLRPFQCTRIHRPSLFIYYPHSTFPLVFISTYLRLSSHFIWTCCAYPHTSHPYFLAVYCCYTHLDSFEPPCITTAPDFLHPSPTSDSNSPITLLRNLTLTHLLVH